MDNTGRFSGHAASYTSGRPVYPYEAYRFLQDAIGLDSSWTVADIGAGTGKLSQLFLGKGNAVYGVEPNDEMRAEALRTLSKYRKYSLIPGTAENTGLLAGSVDLVVAGQAFTGLTLTGQELNSGGLSAKEVQWHYCGMTG